MPSPPPLRFSSSSAVIPSAIFIAQSGSQYPPPVWRSDLEFGPRRSFAHQRLDSADPIWSVVRTSAHRWTPMGVMDLPLPSMVLEPSRAVLVKTEPPSSSQLFARAGCWSLSLSGAEPSRADFFLQSVIENEPVPDSSRTSKPNCYLKPSYVLGVSGSVFGCGTRFGRALGSWRRTFT